jgi:hypothetical protein
MVYYFLEIERLPESTKKYHLQDEDLRKINSRFDEDFEKKKI